MASDQPTNDQSGQEQVADLVVAKARETARSDDAQARIYQAISVQRPVVLEFLKSLRRDKPDATAAEILKELDKRYVAAVTLTSAGVGASAAIPVVGTGIALTLGVTDLLFFYEISALYVLAATELHGIAVHDAERARPLVFGMLLGEKSQSKVAAVVLKAAGAGSVTHARKAANVVAKRALPKGWGEVLAQQLPDSAIAPVATVIAKQALKESAKFGAGTLGKVIPFGIGAVVGGVGSFSFGRSVVKSARLAFAVAPTEFPEVLLDFSKPDLSVVAQSRAVKAMQAAAGRASDFGEAAWGKATEVVDLFRPGEADADGVRVEARALTAAKSAGAAGKRAGSAVKGAAIGGAGAVGARVKRVRDAKAARKATEEDASSD